MLTTRLPVRVFFSCALLASTLFAGASLFSNSPASAQNSGPDAALAQDIPARARDPRWLALVTQRDPQPAGPRTQSADAALTLNINLSSGDVAGNAPSAAPVNIRAIRNGAAYYYGRVTPFSLNGELIYADMLYRNYGEGYTSLQAGDVIEVSAAGQILTLSIQPLSARVDAATDRVSGTAPGAQPLTLFAYLNASPGVVFSNTISVNANGAYSTAVGSADFKAGDGGYVLHRPGAGQSVTVRYIAAKLMLPAGRGDVRITGTPKSSATVTVTNTRGLAFTTNFNLGLLGEAVIDPAAYVPDWTSAVASVTLSSDGFIVSAATAPLDAIYNEAAQRVTGNAQAGQRVTIALLPLLDGTFVPDFTTPLSTSTVVADAGGVFTASLTLTPERGAVASVTSADGHETYWVIRVPALRINLGDDRPDDGSLYYDAAFGFFAVLTDPYAPVTVTLLGAGGTPKTRYRTRTANNGAVFGSSYEELPRFATGDTLVIDDGKQPVSSTIPLFSGTYDAQSNRFGGVAAPNSMIEFDLIQNGFNYGPDYPYNPGTDGVPSQPPWLPRPIPPVPPQLPVPVPTRIPPITPTAAPPAPTPGPLTEDRATQARQTENSAVAPTGGGWPEPIPRVVVTSTAAGAYGFELPVTSGAQTRFSVVAKLRDARGVVFVKQFIYTGQTCRTLRYVEVGGNAFTADNNCRDQSGVLQLLSSTGVVKAETQFFGSPVSTFLSPGGIPVRIAPGDRLRIAGAASDALVVPELSVSYDHNAGRVQGRAPAGMTIEFRSYQDSRVLNSDALISTTVSASGDYSRVLTLPPSGIVRAYFTDAQGVRFGATAARPGLTLYPGQSQMSIVLNMLEPYTLNITSTAQFSQTGNGYQFGGVSGSIQPAFLLPGDLISVTTPLRTLAMRMPVLRAVYDPVSGVLTGSGPAGAPLTIRVLTAPFTRAVFSTTVASSGQFSYTLPFATAGSTIVIEYLEGSDNRVVTWPSESISETGIGGACMVYERGLPTATRIATLYDANGTVKSRITVGPFFLSACFDKPILPTDRIAITELNLLVVEVIVPNIDLRFDRAGKVIRGRIPPNREFWLFGQDGTYGIAQPTLRGTSDASGNFAIDISGGALRGAQTANFVFSDAQNNKFGINLNVAQYQVAMPVVRR